MKRGMQSPRSLAENLFSLEEPWRGRFLILVAQQATRWTWDGQPPTRDEVATWLGDGNLHQVVTQLLNTWQKCEEEELLPVH